MKERAPLSPVPLLHPPENPVHQQGGLQSQTLCSREWKGKGNVLPIHLLEMSAELNSLTE